MTQQQLATICRVTQRAVCAWELGTAIPSPRHTPKLAKAFKMTPEEVTHLFDVALTK